MENTSKRSTLSRVAIDRYIGFLIESGKDSEEKIPSNKKWRQENLGRYLVLMGILGEKLDSFGRNTSRGIRRLDDEVDMI